MKNRTPSGNKFIILLGMLIFFPTQEVKARLTGVHVGAGLWSHASSGQITTTNTDVDFENNLGMDSDFSGFTYVSIEYAHRYIPNFRFNQYSVESSKSSILTTTNAFTFSGFNYSSGASIESTVEWDESDVLFYYKMQDKIYRFDYGLGLKSVSTQISITSSGTTRGLTIEENLPFAYIKAEAYIPAAGISVALEQGQSFLGDMGISQTNFKVAYKTRYHLGIEIGFRSSNVDLNDITDLTGEIKHSGPFVNMLIHY